MMRVIEMGERDKEKICGLKKKEEYDLARSEESLEQLIRDEQQKIEAESSSEGDHSPDRLMETYRYFKKIDQDLDTNDVYEN